MAKIWDSTNTPPAATDRVPVDTGPAGGPRHWTGQQVADLSIYFGATVNALGSVNTNTTIDFADGKVITATIAGSLTFTFSNPPASGAFEAFLFITNGGSAVITWPGSLSWSGGTAPTLRSSGLDLIRIYTNNGGTNWFGTLDYDETSFATSGAVTSSGLTMATARLLGRTTASTGAVEEISVGAGLTLASTTISASKVLARFLPNDNQPPSSSFATLDTRNSILVLDFDAAADESAVFVGSIPDGAVLTSGLLVRIFWAATSATSGNVRWRVAFEADGTDVDSDSFDTATEANGAANGTSGIETVTEITATAIDSLAAGDRFRLRVTRVGTDGTNDTMTGDAELLFVELRGVA